MNQIKFKIASGIFILLFITSCAPPPDSGGSPMGFIGPFLPFVLIIILFYFLIIRPQSKQQNAREDMLKSLKKGANILTNGGMLARIVDILDDDVLMIEISKGVNIKIKREFVNSIIDKEEKINKN
ncbi:preprotein translocase subunit YajC [bacterium]|jgi:preprotein translocase subunit YajC|nr:preprotein translocase subunit YajC [bacterium]MBT3795311.1 preprotein translocase subunit YajC [bacterium]MBT4634277.1 preprotein translocase subunit YajC [bacterium]